MGLLLRRETGEQSNLPVRCVIGRHASCTVAVSLPHVSGEHAVVRWTGHVWELRDLGSRNGTFVDGQRLDLGMGVPLTEGGCFTFGGSGVSFELLDASPPAVAARAQDDGTWRRGTHGLLILPDDEHPLMSVSEERDGRWIAESEQERRAVRDGQTVEVGGRLWRLSLPVPDMPTCDAPVNEATLDTLHLRFAVSRDEEHVSLCFTHGAREVKLPERAYHYLLLTLARARLEDASDGERGEDCGWIDRERLCRMLGTDANKLNVDIYRARKQLASFGVHGAAGLIERRTTSGEIRLGTDQVSVERL